MGLSVCKPANIVRAGTDKARGRGGKGFSDRNKFLPRTIGLAKAGFGG
jgi:hypothetical protein